jgi:hypothetical protein
MSAGNHLLRHSRATQRHHELAVDVRGRRARRDFERTLAPREARIAPVEDWKETVKVPVSCVADGVGNR